MSKQRIVEVINLLQGIDIPKDAEEVLEFLRLTRELEQLLAKRVSELPDPVIPRPKPPLPPIPDLEKTGGKGLGVLAGLFSDAPVPLNFRPNSPLVQGPDKKLPQAGPRFPKVFPPEGWAEKMNLYATGKRSARFKPSAEALQVKSDVEAFKETMKTKGKEDVRGLALAKTLVEKMHSDYTGRFETERTEGQPQHPDEAKIQRGVIALESLLGAGKGFKKQEERELLFYTVGALKQEDLLTLFQADAVSGRKLYSALYLGAKENPSLKAEFAEIKSQALLARTQLEFNQLDPSGESNKMINGVLTHLQESGMPGPEQNAFIEKLAFKMTLRGKQGNYPDIRVPDTSKDGWREDLSSDLLRIMAETPAVSDESLLKSLEMPVPDLLKVIGHSFAGQQKADPGGKFLARREGDFRIIKLLRNLADTHALHAVPGWEDLKKLLDGLESSEYDRGLFLEEAQKGTPVEAILEILKRETKERATQMARGADGRLERLLTAIKGRKRDKQLELASAIEGPEKKKLTAELKEIDDFIRKFDSLSFSNKDIEFLLERFGRAPLMLMTQESSSTKDTEWYNLRNQMAFFNQMGLHLKTKEDPTKLKKGLDKSTFILPTAGKYLKDCTWIESTALDLVRIAEAIQKSEPGFTLDKYPIIIIDQTDGDGQDESRKKKWKENNVYVKKLEAQYAHTGLKIRHVSMAEVDGMIRGSGVEKMFDTTGEHNAGYGGARNMAFLLGPVIHGALKEGKALSSIKPEDLAKAIKDNTLEDAPKIFMGDDTDYVAPGTVFSKVTMATDENLGENYSLMPTSRGGRDTTGVSPAYVNGISGYLEQGGLEAYTRGLFGSNKWNISNKTPGMGCVFGDPRFCLDLPTGAEEKQHDAVPATTDHFSQAMHLSGDRQSKTSDFAKGFMAYSNMTETIKSLVNDAMLPWNAESKSRKSKGEEAFGGLGEVLEHGVKPESRKAMQKSYLERLVKWKDDSGSNIGLHGLDKDEPEKIQKYLKNHPEIDAESRDELLTIKAVFEDGRRQTRLVKDFTDRLLKRLGADKGEQDVRIQVLMESVESDPKVALKAIRDTRKQMEEEGIKFNGSNRILRDFYLVAESVGGGGFIEMSEKLVGD